MIGNRQINFLVDNVFVEKALMDSLDPHKIKRIEVIYPLDAVETYGQDKINGIVKIELKSN